MELRLCYTAIMGIQAGLNPRIIEEQLRNVLGGQEHGSSAPSSAGGTEQKKVA